jgi:hypothetical protein
MIQIAEKIPTKQNNTEAKPEEEKKSEEEPQVVEFSFKNALSAPF